MQEVAEAGPVKGDRDKPGETRVADLQRRLVALALDDRPPNGHFDVATETALRRFQWYLLNRRWRLRVTPGGTPASGLVEAYPAVPGVTIDGTADAITASELQAWQDGGWRPTSSLVRLALAPFTNTELSQTFRLLNYPGAQAGEALVHDGFVAGFGTLDRVAGETSVRIRVNQTFRVQGMPPRGAVVAPATRSQHLIGRAVDGNWVDGANVATTAIMRAGRQTKNVTNFIRRAKEEGLRWGGDFGDFDPIHFDDPIVAATEDYGMHFFFCQRAYADQHAMRTQ